MKSLMKRYWRYTKYRIRYIFKERLFGLDFTMRDKSLLKKTNGTMHGYSITPEEHIREILAHLDFTKCSAFLDIGCGKGLVLKIVSGGSFQSLGGIEYDERPGGTTIIYHNPTCHQLILDTGYFRLKEQLYDAEKDYYTNIYESIA